MSSQNLIGQPFIELLTVESTNNYAMGLARAGMAQHGSAVFTHEQTKGKGQRNKEWASQTGQNIALSIIIEPAGPNHSQLFLLSMMAAVSVHHLLAGIMPGEIKIKWPNDIYWRDRKAAGILIENLWQGREWKLAVIGIGINVNQTSFGDLEGKAVSIKQVISKDLNPVQLSKQLCTILEEKYRLLISSPAHIIEQYKSHLYKLGETVKLKKENRVFEARVKDVGLDGKLLVQHSIEEAFDVGEVEWVISGE